jgi:phage-related tail protein
MTLSTGHIIILVFIYMAQKIGWDWLKNKNGGSIFNNTKIVNQAISDNSIKSKIYDTNNAVKNIQHCLDNGKRGYEQNTITIEKMKDNVDEVKAYFSQIRTDVTQQTMNTKLIIENMSKLVSKIDELIVELRKN